MNWFGVGIEVEGMDFRSFLGNCNVSIHKKKSFRNL
jgi:hypothetical protein